MPTIRVGTIGLSTKGWATQLLIPQMLHPSQNGAYKLVSICTSSPESATLTAEKWGVKSATIEEMVNDEKVDLVVVSVRAPKHLELVIPFLTGPKEKKAKNIFVEWPAGGGLRQALQIRDEYRRRKEVSPDLKVMVGLQGRFSPTITKLRELISSNKVGRILSTTVIGSVPSAFNAWGPTVSQGNLYTVDKDGGATMLTVPIGHFLDPFILTLGDIAHVSAQFHINYPESTVVSSSYHTPSSASAEATHPKKINSTTPDTISITGSFSSGALLTIHWRVLPSSHSKGQVPFLWLIDGTEGSIKLEGQSGFTNIHEPKLYVDGELVDVSAPTGGNEGLNNVGREWKEFASGGDKFASIEDAVKVHSILEAIKLSADSGKRIKVDYA